MIARYFNDGTQLQTKLNRYALQRSTTIYISYKIDKG